MSDATVPAPAGTYTATPTSTLSPAAEQARRMTWPTAAVAWVVSSALSAQGAHGVAEAVVLPVLLALVTAGIYGWLVPSRLRTGRVGTPALVLSVVALLLILPAFWSGLPMVLGAAGAVLGHAGRGAGTGGGRSIAAVVVGALAVVAYLASYVTEILGI